MQCIIFPDPPFLTCLKNSDPPPIFHSPPPSVLYDRSLIAASGTRQIDKIFIKGLLTIQDQEHFKTRNKRKLRQQYRKSRSVSGDKTAPWLWLSVYTTLEPPY